MIAQRVRGSSLWTPAKIATAVWLDASDSASMTTVSNIVSEWRDKSGNARHATQTTDSCRPTYSASAFNGKPGLSFDGVDDRLIFSLAVLSVTHSLFLVIKPTTESAIGSPFGQWESGKIGRFVVNCNQDSAGDPASGYINFFNSTATLGAGTSGFLAHTQFSAAGNQFASICTTGAENWKLVKDGTEQDSATVTELYTGVNSAIGSVSAAQLLYPFDGVVSEVLLINAAVPVTTRQRLEGYLAHKWGLTANLPAAHPYKVAPPRS